MESRQLLLFHAFRKLVEATSNPSINIFATCPYYQLELYKEILSPTLDTYPTNMSEISFYFVVAKITAYPSANNCAAKTPPVMHFSLKLE